MLVNAEKLPEIQTLDPGIESNTKMGADALLQTSRRIDWRFLLPNPELGDVAYIGASDRMHIRALNAFSKSLVVFSRTPSQSEQALKFDVVVICAPTISELASTVYMIKPGGFLYLETYGLFWLVRLKRRSTLWSGLKRIKFHTSRQYLATLSTHRIVPMGTFLHWPDFENCTRIVPMDNASGFELAINHLKINLPNHWRSKLLEWALRTGIPNLFGPCVGYIAQRGIE